jgi:hypothetical protein
MPDYQLGKIYKIVCNITRKVYYGSTCEPTLARRLAKHMNGYNSFKNGIGRYVTSYSILENDDYYIVLVEKCPCNDKMELHQRERFYIENNECVNKVIPNRTNIEYKRDNKEIIQENAKEYYQNNKEKRDNQHKNYYEQNKDKISEYNKEYQKEYYESNKDVIKEHSKQYKLNNRERIKEYNTQIIICACGKTLTLHSKSAHEKTQKHNKYFLKLDNNQTM